MNLTWLEDFYKNNNVSIAIQISISIGIILLVAFLLTRITKLLKLPNVTAYIISGVVIGPFVLNMIPNTVASGMSFVTDIALGFISFSIGRYFDVSNIKKGLGKIIVITLCESVICAVGVTLVMWACNLEFGVALILGAIASTTSAVSTMMTIKQYRCSGDFVDNTLKVIALDNVFGLLLFSVVVSISTNMLSGNANVDIFRTVFLPILLNIAVIAIGGLFGFILARIITPSRSKDNRLILTVAMVLFLIGICGLFSIIDDSISISPLLSTMIFGTTYVNLTHDSKLVDQLNDFSAPITLWFFVMSGINFKLDMIASVGIAGIAYLFVRIVLKYAGASLGAFITKSDKNTLKYLGMPLIPQAGVSIGLATLAASMLTGISDYGDKIAAIVVSTGIIYEIIGPAMAKLSLKLAGGLTEDTIKKVKKGEIRIDTSSMLKDTEVIYNNEELLARRKALEEIKKDCEKTNRYIHTKAYKEQLNKE